MTAKHNSPEWHRTTRIIRSRVKQQRERGEEVTCWRCGRPIGDEQPYDVGHLDPMAGEGVENAAPEHRGRSAFCLGNRAAGGRVGARVTNARKAGRSTFVALPWA